MKPGRELDAKIAAVQGLNVLGIVPCTPDPECSGHYLSYDGCGSEPRPVYLAECVCELREADDVEFFGHIAGCLDVVIEYSTDIAAAFTVDKPGWLWEFKEMPEMLSVTLYTSFALRRKAIRWYPILPDEVVLIQRKWLDDKVMTYAWLRCLAALEAVGVEVDDA